jgi:hypothetical protein
MSEIQGTSVSNGTRTIPLGCGVGPGETEDHCSLVYRMDLSGRTNSAHSIRGIRSWPTVPRLGHAEQPRHICSTEMARDVILLACAFVFWSSEHLGFSSPSTYQSCIRFATNSKYPN